MDFLLSQSISNRDDEASKCDSRVICYSQSYQLASDVDGLQLGVYLLRIVRSFGKLILHHIMPLFILDNFPAL